MSVTENKDGTMKLRIIQRKDEPVDLAIIRAFADARPYWSRNSAQAAIQWMWSVTKDQDVMFLNEIKP